MSTMPATAEFVISTSSEVIPEFTFSGQAPTITVNGAPFGQLPAPQSCTGFQLLIMNAGGDLTSPDSILFNDYFLVQSAGGAWGSLYQYVYEQITGAVLTTGNIEQQLIILTSFGYDANMAPANDTLQLFLPRGAGAGLQQWATVPDAGSQGAGWVAAPVSYILLGGPSYGYGDGSETFVTTDPATATLNVTLANNVPPTPPSQPQAEPVATD